MSPYTTAGLPFQSSSDTSREAAIRAEKFVGQQGELVFRLIAQVGPHGVTQKEAAAVLELGRPSVCARFNALEASGRIQKTTARRGGCAVYQVT